jgi:ankyrin repeat protein
MKAAFRNHSETVKLLIERGADLDQEGRGQQAETALTLAAEHGNTEIIKILLANGAHINNPEAEGRTPLHMAVENRELDAVKVLLSFKPKLSIQDNYGRTALSLAQDLKDAWNEEGKRNQAAIVKLMKAASAKL